MPKIVEYVQKALSTESNDFDAIASRLRDNRTVRLLHGALGAVTESGELADVLKKHIFYGKPLDTINISEEVGDLFWYCAIIADALDDDFESIMRRNIEKLRARYDGNFKETRAQNRDLERERKILES